MKNEDLGADFRSVRAGCWELDLRTDTNTWSDELWPVSGLTSRRKKSSYASWLQYVHPDDRDFVTSLIQTSATLGKHLNIEWRVNRQSTPEQWFMSQGLPEYDEYGNVIGYSGIVIDITERKQTEENLKQYKNIISSTPDAITFIDPDYRYIIVNDAYKDFTGIKDIELPGLTVADSFGEERFQRILKPHLDRCLKGEVINYQEWFESPALGRRFVDVSYFPYRDTNNKIAGIIGNRRDITERKRIEEVQAFLAQTCSGVQDEPFFNVLARYLAMKLEMDFVSIDRLEGDGLTAKNLAVWCDGNFRESVQYNLKERPSGNVVGKSCFCVTESICDFFPDSQMLKELRAESYVGATLWSHTNRPIGLITAVGRTRLKNRRLAEVTLELVGIRAAGVLERLDAEEAREKLQMQLNQAQKMESVGRLAGGVAHDFNNMLMVILGNTELAMAKADTYDPIQDELMEIRKAAIRSADLTRQLLAFASRQAITPKVMDLNEIVQGMLKMLKRLIGEDIDLAWQSTDSLWPIKVDPSQIDQILANLCVNARDAINGVGKLTIKTDNLSFNELYCSDHPDTLPGDYVLLAVSDDGCGMDSEILQNLFEPFFTTKESGKGTGLGLATVYGIVRQNGGFINVYSEPGSGSTFNIYLPRYASTTPQMCKKEDVILFSKGHETILLVEDQQEILKMATVMLERLGYTVLAASMPGQAIRLAMEHTGQIHLLMTDVIMPEMNGRDLASTILSLHPNIKQLFMSGYTADVIACQGVLDDGVNFIQKPFLIHDLANKVREVIAS